MIRLSNNKRGAGNGAVALLFQIGRLQRTVPDRECQAA